MPKKNKRPDPLMRGLRLAVGMTAETASEKLRRLETKYGPDFVKKLSHYRTAQLNGVYVSIQEVDTRTFDALVKTMDRHVINCSALDLDHFVL